jgi:thioesterase DpgC
MAAQLALHGVHVVEELVSGLTSSGIVSAAGNRRAFRIAEEPLDLFLFRNYMAIYTREQAYATLVQP